jgi:hypothetical protein
MNQLTIETTQFPDGLAFKHSVGMRFFLVVKPGGGAVLYRGEYGIGPAGDSLVDFDISVRDLRQRAEKWVLAFPDPPA